MTTMEIEYAISRMFDVRTHLMVPNISWGLMNHEADVLVVRIKSGYCVEFEIKQTFSDYVKDFNKRKWQKAKLSGWKTGLGKQIKEFYYVFPNTLWEKRRDDIEAILPDFAGVVVCTKDNAFGFAYAQTVISPTINNMAVPLKSKVMFDVARLGTMRIWNLKRELISLKNKSK